LAQHFPGSCLVCQRHTVKEALHKNPGYCRSSFTPEAAASGAPKFSLKRSTGNHARRPGRLPFCDASIKRSEKDERR
jgi:hypothetical protein